jgi:phosphoheptose isomerase
MSQSSQVLQRIVRESTEVIGQLTALAPQVDAASRALLDCFANGGKLLTCGNGGSAADAAHMTTEFVCRFVEDRPGYPAICLNVHGGDMTAITNDYTYDRIFARQVEAYGKPGDVLIGFSTSGNSASVIKAIETANQRGLTSIAMLGRDGGVMKGMAAIELLVDNDVTARIQEAHQVLVHVICETVDAELVRRG